MESMLRDFWLWQGSLTELAHFGRYGRQVMNKLHIGEFGFESSHYLVVFLRVKGTGGIEQVAIGIEHTEG